MVFRFSKFANAIVAKVAKVGEFAAGFCKFANAIVAKVAKVGGVST